MRNQRSIRLHGFNDSGKFSNGNQNVAGNYLTRSTPTNPSSAIYSEHSTQGYLKLGHSDSHVKSLK